MSLKETNPPRETQRVMRISDLPSNRRPARFLISNQGGETQTVVLSKRRRQIIELLMRGPVYCASPVRISDIVSVLKHETCIDIHTEFYAGDRDIGAGDYGVYFLRSTVCRIDDVEAAA